MQLDFANGDDLDVGVVVVDDDDPEGDGDMTGHMDDDVPAILYKSSLDWCPSLMPRLRLRRPVEFVSNWLEALLVEHPAIRS